MPDTKSLPRFELEVEPLAATAVTGRLGTFIARFRNREYRIALGGREHTCDGKPVSLSDVPASVIKRATGWYDKLAAEYARRRGGCFDANPSVLRKADADA